MADTATAPKGKVVKMVKTVAPAAPAPKAMKVKAPVAAPAKPAKAEKVAKEAKPSRNKGVTTGMGISQYQNMTLQKNVKAKLTDEQLAADWRREFPQAAEFSAATVAGVRRVFNLGKHKNDVPPKPSVSYDENGNALPAPTRGRKKGEVD